MSTEKAKHTVHRGSDEDTAVLLPPLSAGGRGSESVSAGTQVDLGALSHPGKVRSNNEDHYLAARFERSMHTLLTNLPPGLIPEQCGETAYGMLVADGLGGAAAGEVASSSAIRVLLDLVLETPDWIMRLTEDLLQEVLNRMEQRFQKIQIALVEQGQEAPDLTGMATTMTLACSLGPQLILAHAGDSRAYLLRHGQLLRLTRDHTVAQRLADMGKIRPEDISRHPRRHVLTNALGGEGDRVLVEGRTLQLEDDDQLLLCTDGLTEMVPENTIQEVLRSAGTSVDACHALVGRALDAGGKDNVTVVVARYHIRSR